MLKEAEGFLPGYKAEEGPVDLPLEDLRKGEFSVRSNVRDTHVRTLAEVPESWPPILVDRQSHEIIDGVHRFYAATFIGKPTISCTLFDGDAHEALLEAIHRNVEHGLPLSLKERQMAARRVLSRCEEWSDRKIAALWAVAEHRWWAPGPFECRKRTVERTTGDRRPGEANRRRGSPAAD